MDRKKLLLLLVGSLFFLVGLGGALLLKQAPNFGEGSVGVTSNGGRVIEPILFKSTDPVKMAVAADQSQVEWIVRGRFVKEFEQRGDFFEGYFVVDGDGLGYELPIWIGPSGATILLSTSERISESEQKVTWNGYLLDEAIPQIPLNDFVSVHFIDYIVDGNTSAVAENKKFWVAVNQQIQQGGSVKELDLPDSLWLYSTKVGL